MQLSIKGGAVAATTINCNTIACAWSEWIEHAVHSNYCSNLKVHRRNTKNTALCLSNEISIDSPGSSPPVTLKIRVYSRSSLTLLLCVSKSLGKLMSRQRVILLQHKLSFSLAARIQSINYTRLVKLVALPFITNNVAVSKDVADNNQHQISRSILSTHCFSQLEPAW